MQTKRKGEGGEVKTQPQHPAASITHQLPDRHRERNAIGRRKWVDLWS